MTDTALIHDLARQGITLIAHGGRLRIRGPAALLTDDLRATLASRKPELLAVLDSNWSAAASALFTRLARTISEDDWYALEEQFSERIAICEGNGSLPLHETQRIAYEQLAAAAEQCITEKY